MFPTFIQFINRHPRYFALLGFLLFINSIVLWAFVQDFTHKSDVHSELPKVSENVISTDLDTVKIADENVLSTEFNGVVIEVSAENSFIRAYNTDEVLVHTIFVSTSTVITDVDNSITVLNDLKQGSHVKVIAQIDQDARDINADSVLNAKSISVSELDTQPVLPKSVNSESI